MACRLDSADRLKSSSTHALPEAQCDCLPEPWVERLFQALMEHSVRKHPHPVNRHCVPTCSTQAPGSQQAWSCLLRLFPNLRRQSRLHPARVAVQEVAGQDDAHANENSRETAF